MNKSDNKDPSHRLFKEFSGVGHWANTRLDATLSRRCLSVAKLSVLRELCQASEPLPLGQIAERLTCAKSNVTQLVDRLEHEGLVRRVPHPDDRRCTRAAITKEGQRLCEWGLQAESEVERRLFANLSKRKREQLASLIAEIRLDADWDVGSERIVLGNQVDGWVRGIELEDKSE